MASCLRYQPSLIGTLPLFLFLPPFLYFFLYFLLLGVRLPTLQLTKESFTAPEEPPAQILFVLVRVPDAFEEGRGCRRTGGPSCVIP